MTLADAAAIAAEKLTKAGFTAVGWWLDPEPGVLVTFTCFLAGQSHEFTMTCESGGSTPAESVLKSFDKFLAKHAAEIAARRSN